MNARHWWSLSTVKWDLDYSSCWQQTEPLKYVNVSDYWDAFLCLFWTSAIKPRFQKHHVAANRRLSQLCLLPTDWSFVNDVLFCSCFHLLQLLLVFQIFESGLFHFHITVLAQGRTFTGAHCTILFIQQLNNKGWLDSNSVTCISFWLVY